MLRVEDTDQARSSESSTRGILKDLAWLGIDWDEGPELADDEGVVLGGDPRSVGPFFQAKRLEIYTQHLNELIEKDCAYPAFDTAEELAELRSAAEAKKETFRYHRAEDYDRDDAIARMNAGESCVVRLRAPAQEIVVNDCVLGEVRFGAGELDDFVIRKADGYPTYHFAVVVDDELMGVTHVLRGQEHLMNTPRHQALQKVLGFGTPSYAHMPLIFNADGSKMSKRDKDKAARKACKAAGLKDSPVACIDDAEFTRWMGDKRSQLASDQLSWLGREMGVELPEIDVEDFRASGYVPEALCNYVALLGWNPGMKCEDGTDLERFSMAFLAEHFSLERIGKSNAKFDRAKLLSFNAHTLQTMEAGAFVSCWKDYLSLYQPEMLTRFDDSQFELLASMTQPRCKTLRDALEPISFVIAGDDEIVFDDKAVRKVLLKGEPSGLSFLAEIEPVLRAVEPFQADEIEEAIKAFCEAREIGMGKVAQPLRVAMTGLGVSPPLGQTLEILGQQAVLSRIDRCAAAHAT